MRKTFLALLIGATLASCGGGGGGGSSPVIEPPVTNKPWALTKLSAGGFLDLNQGGCSHYNILAPGDINNDGHDDVVLGPLVCQGVVSYSKVMIGIYDPATKMYKSDAAVQARMPEMQWAQRAIAKDFNNDGYTDLFLVGTGPDYGQPCGEAPFMFLGSSNGLVDHSHLLPRQSMYTHQMTYADFNNDGKMDFALLNNPWVPLATEPEQKDCYYQKFPGTRESYIVLSNGNTWESKPLNVVDPKMIVAGFPYPIIGQAKNSYNAVTAGDVNNDGNADLVVFGSNWGQLAQRAYTLLGDGKGAFSVSSYFIETPYGDNTVSIAPSLRQLDGSGTPELIVNYAKHPGVASTGYQYGSYEVFKFSTESLTWTKTTSQYLTNKTGILETEGGWCPYIQWADLNGDGKDDFVCGTFKEIPYNDTAFITPRIWLRTADGKFEPAYHTGFDITNLFGSMTIVRVDGKTKVVGLNKNRSFTAGNRLLVIAE